MDARLRDSLRRMESARRDAVRWFGAIVRERLYEQFGCSSIHQYAALRLGFSPARTAYFLRMVRAFADLPAIREATESGALSWTKAREIVTVATPQTEGAWLDLAQTLGRRELEERVQAARGAARAGATRSAGVRARGQGELGLAAATDAGERPSKVAGDGVGNGVGERASNPASCGAVAGPPGGPPGESADAPQHPDVPLTVSFRLRPEQYAHYEALLETLRRNRMRGSREDLLLHALAALVESARVAPADETESPAERPVGTGPAARSTEPRTRIVLHVCERCGHGETPTSRGTKVIDAATLAAAACDARVERAGERSRATVPPSVRKAVLARDGHRCRSAGCGSARFLDVHHVVPRSAGGTNAPENLMTLCAACHRLVHVLQARRHGREARPTAHGGGEAHRSLGARPDRTAPSPG